MFFKYLSLSRLHWRLRRHLPLPPVISPTISFSAFDDEWSPAKKTASPLFRRSGLPYDPIG